ncbi:MAG: TolB protein [Thermoleophilaceae bacterium]|jgi:Tol biopolymer transport system component|nr:TolB protein [Thermoleophilaceae bacterium]
MTSPRPYIAALACVGALALTACGSSDSGKTTKAKSPAVGVEAPGLIAFRRYTDDAQKEGSVFTIRPDGTGEHQVSHSPAGHVDDFPAMSADGRRIAFERCAEAKPCQVWLMNADGGQLRRLHVRCALAGPCDVSGPAWSRDGRLAVTLASGRVKKAGSGDQIQRSDIVAVDPDRGTQTSVVHVDNFQGDLLRPVWSPDGRRIAYEHPWSALSKRVGKTALEVVSLSGGAPQRITPFALAAGDGPDWSPDGNWIVFRTHSDSDMGPTNLAVVHPDGSGLHELTHFDAARRRVLSSSYSPDGKWIAYGARVNGAYPDVFIMHSDGTGGRPLTRTQAWDSAPEWAGNR